MEPKKIATVKDYMNQKPHVLVTEYGVLDRARVELNGELFPVIDLKWHCKDRIPVVTLTFHARLEVRPFEDAEPEKRPRFPEGPPNRVIQEGEETTFDSPHEPEGKQPK